MNMNKRMGIFKLRLNFNIKLIQYRGETNEKTSNYPLLQRTSEKIHIQLTN